MATAQEKEEMRQGGGAGGSALSIWVRALAEGGEAAGEIKSDAAGHQSDWASGLLHPVIFRPAERERRAGNTRTSAGFADHAGGGPIAATRRAP